MDQHQQQLPQVLTISPPTPFQVSKVSYVIPIYRVKASPCRLLHQAQEKIHVSLPMSLPTSNAFSLERPIRCSVKSARVEAITVIIPVQRLARIIIKKPHAMQSRHPITASSFSPLLVLAVVVLVRFRLRSSRWCECRGTVHFDECGSDPTPLFLRTVF
jgi:hypothetical protein